MDLYKRPSKLFWEILLYVLDQVPHQRCSPSNDDFEHELFEVYLQNELHSSGYAINLDKGNLKRNVAFLKDIGASSFILGLHVTSQKNKIQN